ncbi:PREDICTED: uncharacterized protein LOC106819530, partial [Priapulus caudatus]|uniref:ATP-dependent DNA helicase n=1 Tax=Priapulus caudatus TaxID=37621 RepID=A0ABM1F5B2_PRICU
MVKRKTSLNKTTRTAAHMTAKRQRPSVDVAHQQPQHPEAYGYVEEHFTPQTCIGPMNKICQHCQAATFTNEPPGFCCCNGKIKLPCYPQPPPYLSSLLNDDEHFLCNIRTYNCAFQMTSFACTTRQLSGWNPTFTVQRQVFHNIGSMYPQPNRPPQFLQIYFIDNKVDEVNTRLSIANQLKPEIVANLRDMLHEHNQYVKAFKTAADTLHNINAPDLTVVIHEDKPPSNEHARRFNIPVANEVAILMPNEPTASRDIVIHQRDVESERLHFLRREQKTLRADNYSNLQDSLLTADSNPASLGQRVVLPARFTGGPRYMHQKQQDAITYVREFGRPDLFITTTTNPKWHEIIDNLLPHQTAPDRPDIVVRVFNQKLRKLMHMLKNGCFGDVQAWLYSVEFQKRGLPHAHILIWLNPQSKVTPQDIDLIISAEIPSPTDTPVLHELVKSHMIHGPCGPINRNSPCMKNNQCTKSFPKHFIDTTMTGHDGYPNYRRRMEEDGGHTISLKKNVNRTMQHIIISNQWVVLYNPFLLRQMDSHTNVELCMSVKSIKYVLKYVNKGIDQAIYSLQQDTSAPTPTDEIAQYQHARYVGSTEAAYRLLKLLVYEHFPPVCHLAVHLENGQRVYFSDTTTAQELTNRQPPKTTLTEFFTLCQQDTFARTLTYPQIPQYYTWNNNKWVRRKRGTPVPNHPSIFKTSCLGRVYTISPSQGECYFLRLLLHEKKGPQSFQHLKQVQEVICSTFRQACLLLGLIADDNHLHKALSEANESSSPAQLRNLFAIILTSCEPADPPNLWEQHKDNMSEDLFFPSSQHNLNDDQIANVYNSCLLQIQRKVLQIGGQQLHKYGLNVNHNNADYDTIEYNRYTQYSTSEQQTFLAENEDKLTKEQRHIFDLFCAKVHNSQPGIVFLDAPGGTGKSFLVNLILARICSEKKIAIATASSGIAATILTGGRTLHATFKIPLDVHMQDMPTCAIKKGSTLAKVIINCSALIVDEAPMTHKAAFEVVDRTLQDIRGNTQPFGGIPTLLCGDFRQILPVVKNGTQANIIEASIKRSHLWQYVHMVHFHKNLRAHLTGDSNATAYSHLLMSIGDGTYPVTEPPSTIFLPDNLQTTNDQEQLIQAIFKDLPTKHTNNQWLLQRAILAPLNDTVATLNHHILNMMPGEQITYKSFDSTLTVKEAVHFPVDFLNSLNIAGLPPHKLNLKLGSPIIVLRSLDPPNITNGTRCRVTACHANVIEVVILHGPATGKT